MTADILIIDDEADIRDLISEILTDNGYITRVAKDSETALRAISERVPSAIVLDIWLQGSELDGLGILEMVKKKHPYLPVIMISGHGNIETAVAAIKMGAYDFIEKPFKEERLLLMVAKALEVSRLRQENQELKSRASLEVQFTGVSQPITQVRQAIEKVAPTASRVLITGAQGTGKELAARLIHSRSPRANANLVMLNAASLTPERVEAELFGVEDTAMLGSVEKLGTFERAHGGTLFIDEIADLPLDTQAKILRTLQDGAFTRVGGSRRVEIDVRVIAASTRDLEESMARGVLREDLYYRLNVVPIRMPALRERREDIPELCRYFLKRAADSNGLSPRDLASDAVAALQSYAWPGNVRQLRNMMEWLAIMAGGEIGSLITASQLPQDLLLSNPLMTRPDMNADIMSLALREARELFERQYLAAQIERFGGNISRTSTFVGMERSALHRKLKTLGIYETEEKLEQVG